MMPLFARKYKVYDVLDGYRLILSEGSKGLQRDVHCHR